ncbi:hypothetical protein LCGC14_2529520 [marine sediment metagenome]|uniref:IPT/TIG domain-containing protein n=1 Tax=marine sediment metagenome TaxID=412755 RepID=A0A0F9AUD6_9ZZZZ
MAYTEITVQSPTIAGVIPTNAAATLSDGNRFINTGREFVMITNNGTVNPVVVTIPTPQTINNLTIQDPTVSVAKDGIIKIIGPFPPSIYNNPVGGTDENEVYVEYDQATDVLISVFRV